MTNQGRRVCRHCRLKPVNRPRGLCWNCFYTPGVKELYPSTSRYARRGVGHGTGTGALPEPAGAAAGSEEKVALLAERAAAGLSLFHPAEPRHESAARPVGVAEAPFPRGAFSTGLGREPGTGRVMRKRLSS